MTDSDTTPLLRAALHVDAAHLDAADVSMRTVTTSHVSTVVGIGDLDLFNGASTTPEQFADALERLAGRIRQVDQEHQATGRSRLVSSAHQGADVKVAD